MASKVEIVSRSVERLVPLLKERPALRSQAAEVQRWCGNAPSDAIGSSDAALIVTFFIAAVGEQKDDAIVTTALDSLDRLLAHGVITPLVHTQVPSSAAVPPEDDAPPPVTSGPTLLELIVEAAASRVQGVSEEIQIQVIRLLLTTVAVCEAQGETMMTAVRAIIQILMLSRGSKHTQQTGKAALSQIAGIAQRKAETLAAVNTAAMRDCAALMSTFSDLTAGTDVPRITLGITLLHNFVTTLDPVIVSCDPLVVNVLRREVTSRLIPLLTSTTPHISKSAFYFVQHLVETFRRALRREIPVILNFLYAICERSSNFAIKSMAYGTLVSFAKNTELLFDLYRNYDCEPGTFDVFSQFCDKVTSYTLLGNPTLSLNHDEQLKLLSVSAVGSIAQSLRRYTGQSPSESAQNHSDAAVTSPLKFAPVPEFNDASRDTKTFDEIKQQLREKEIMSRILARFSAKPKDGIAAALEAGIIPDTTPASVAQFLRTKGIDKVAVGDYLSANKPEITDTVREFIHLNDYSGLHIDEAIRLLLGHFKIGGEAQTVDRTMNTFAARYHEQNPEVFPDADVAYVLSFSIMMLNTDLHSPSIKERMTLAGFIRNNAGLNNGQDFPLEMQEPIYNRIKANEIKLNDDSVTIDEEAIGKIVIKRDPNAVWSPDYCVEKTVSRLLAPSEFEVMISPRDPQFASLMFSVAWPNTCKAIAKVLDDASANSKLLSKGFEVVDRYASVACELRNSQARLAFVELLRKLSKVTGHVSLDSIQPKNVKAVDTLVRLATRDGELLEDSWRDVLLVVSKAVKLREALRSRKGDREGKSLPKGEQNSLDALNEGLDNSQLDQLFATSSQLSDSAVLRLVDGLLFTLSHEVKESPSRITSFSQLIELLTQNLARRPQVWKTLWTIVATQIAQIIVKLPKVSDSVFKTLGKFYDGLMTDASRKDFWNQYQVEALHVLWMSVWQSRDSKARHQVLGVVNNVIMKSASRLNAAWLPLGRIFTMLARDIEPQLVASAYFAFKFSLKYASQFDDEAFATMVGAAISFASAGSEDASDAVSVAELLAAFADFGIPSCDDARFADLHDKEDFRTLLTELPALERVTSRRPVAIFDSLVGGLASLVSVHSTPVRTKGIVAAFSVLTTHGDVWSQSASWPQIITGSIAPVFDHLFFELEMPQTNLESTVPVIQRCVALLSTLCSKRKSELADLQSQLFDAVARCLEHRYTPVGEVGVAHLRDWITRDVPANEQFTPIEWSLIAAKAAKVLCVPVNSASVGSITRSGQVLDLIQLAAQKRSPLLATAQDDFLPAMSHLFTYCCEVRVHRDVAAQTALVGLQAKTASVAFDVLRTSQLDETLVEWAKVVIREYVTVSATKAPAPLDGKALADAIHGLLVQQATTDCNQSFSRPLYDDLCELINCCEPRISSVLVAIFKSLKSVGEVAK